MKRIFVLIWVLSPLVLCFTGCSFRDEKVDPAQETQKLEKLVDSTFPTINTYVIQPKCLRCHDKGTSQNHNIDLSSYEKIVNGAAFPPLILPGEPENSSLYTSLVRGDMPKEAPKLPQHVINMIKQWIINGAPKTGLGSGGGNPCDKDDPSCKPPPISCDEGEPGCEAICTEPDEPGCKSEDEGGGCEPDEPGCDDGPEGFIESILNY